MGKVARTKQYENTETPFENPTYDARFDSYPAVAYYKMVPADKTLFPVCVAETMDWYKEGNINSYDEALPAYPSQNPSGYSRVDMCVQYCTQVKNASPRQWEPSARILHSFYGYINASNAGAVNPETDPVRYLVPIPPDALSSHQGLLKIIMDIKTNSRMKTKYIVPLLLFCLFACIACEDETTEMPRLFRPSFIASSCFAESNTITLAWRTSGEATSYTVELSQDATFQSENLETQTVEKGKCTFANLRYETKFYARVRANNESLAITSNWTEMGSSISTLSRTIPKILYAVEGSQINETSVEIKWVVSEKIRLTDWRYGKKELQRKNKLVWKMLLPDNIRLQD